MNVVTKLKSSLQSAYAKVTPVVLQAVEDALVGPRGAPLGQLVVQLQARLGQVDWVAETDSTGACSSSIASKADCKD